MPAVGQTGTVDSAEEFVALTVQMMVLLAEKTAENPENIKYAASATTVKADDGTVYWLIVVEAIANREDLGI